MIGSGDGHRGELSEGVGSRIEEFRGELRGSVREGLRVNLTANDENSAVWQDNTVGKGPLVCHVANCLDSGYGGRGADGDDMSVGSSVNVLIIGSSANSENLACYGIIHSNITAHSITITSARPSRGLRACSCGAIPVHGN